MLKPLLQRNAPATSKIARVAVFVLLAATALLGGCGSRSIPDAQPPTTEQRNAAIVAIAQQFGATEDIEAARVALAPLNLPNPGQSVLALAEAFIAEGQDIRTTVELVALAKALGPISRMAEDFLAREGASSGVAAAVAMAPTATPMPTPTDTPAPPTETPTPEPTATPTSTSAPEPTATPTETPLAQPQAVASSAINVRSGPGTAFAVVGQLQPGRPVDILGRNADRSWWQVLLGNGNEGWVAASVVDLTGPVDGVAVAANIPVAPTPAPRPTNAVAIAPTATLQPQPQPSGPEFKVVGVRLWGVVENGGQFDGPSVHCGMRRDLWIYVLDAAGNRIDGVTIKSAYAPYEEEVSGNKGPGAAQMVLGEAKEIYVIRDQGGREVTSDRAFVSTVPRDIPDEQLISAGYCTDAASCASFKAQYGCYNHHSWDVIFQRSN